MTKTPITTSASPATTGQQQTTAKCKINHSGNRHLTRTVRGFFECDGCAAYYTLAQITEITTH